jgi:predicted transcriptional regulator
MAKPDVSLTPTQLEILQAVWAADGGASVADLWAALADKRDVARTTVLTQVQRLERRGWLRRSERDGVAVYRAAVAREQAESRLARAFVADFFAGSAAGMVKSLLGSGRIDFDELRELKALIARAEKRQ